MNASCTFRGANPLPIVAVDEPLFRRLPCFVIATVDKFASLPWVGPSGILLGGADRYDNAGFYGAADPDKGQRLKTPLAPPDLIIQDELHLISGPLGTIAGLYEAAIDALATREVDGHPILPKILASTATVRRASDQIQALFGRNGVEVFPPPGPDRRDSFFAQTRRLDEQAGRLYVGLSAQGHSLKKLLLRTYLALLGSAQKAWLDEGGAKNPNNPADPYMTLVRYFNSLRWPADRRPEVYYDPRGLSTDPATRATWHAKCVVVDDELAFVTSANFTEWARDRNVEAGVLIRSRSFNAQLRQQVDSLVRARLVTKLSQP